MEKHCKHLLKGDNYITFLEPRNYQSPATSRKSLIVIKLYKRNIITITVSDVVLW